MPGFLRGASKNKIMQKYMYITEHKCIYRIYSRKIWRELNLAKSPKTTKIKYWRNLNLAIVYSEGYDIINDFWCIYANQQLSFFLVAYARVGVTYYMMCEN